MKKILSVLMILALLLTVTACNSDVSSTTITPNSNSNAASSTTAEKEIFKIGYANRLDSDEFLKNLKDKFQTVAGTDTSLEVIFADANNDSQKQLDQIDNFLVQGVDALVLCPNDMAAIVPAIEKANKMNIPVICFSIEAGGGDFFYVGVSNKDCGLMQGKYMADTLPKNANILYLGGNSGYQISIDRRDGFLEGISTRPDINILSKMECMYTLDEGMKITEDWIQTFPEFDAIIAVNDLSALGAVQALLGANLIDKVKVSGIDAIDDAKVAVKEGKMVQTVMQDSDGQVNALYDVIKQLQSGQTPTKKTMVPLVSITKENIDQYLK
jgi:ABC-type sugar transport system substrate-binding protein